jgi:hypothetical protein
MNPFNAFVTEGNVEIYLSRLHTTLNRIDRDNLLRLLAAEQAKMGGRREHLENGERRVADGLVRLQNQRDLVARDSHGGRPDDHGRILLETLEMTQVLLEEHMVFLRQRFEQAKL